MDDFIPVFLGLLFLFGFVIGSVVQCETKEDELHPKNFIEKPYCETATIQEQEYKRCWKTEEIK